MLDYEVQPRADAPKALPQAPRACEDNYIYSQWQAQAADLSSLKAAAAVIHSESPSARILHFVHPNSTLLQTTKAQTPQIKKTTPSSHQPNLAKHRANPPALPAALKAHRPSPSASSHSKTTLLTNQKPKQNQSQKWKNPVLPHPPPPPQSKKNTHPAHANPPRNRPQRSCPCPVPPATPSSNPKPKEANPNTAAQPPSSAPAPATSPLPTVSLARWLQTRPTSLTPRATTQQWPNPRLRPAKLAWAAAACSNSLLRKARFLRRGHCLEGLLVLVLEPLGLAASMARLRLTMRALSGSLSAAARVRARLLLRRRGGCAIRGFGTFAVAMSGGGIAGTLGLRRGLL